MMKQKITKENLIECIRQTFPELEDRYQARVDFWKKSNSLPSEYDVVRSVFLPKFREELASGGITEFLQRSALFIDRVCTSGDIEALNVVWTELFEWLIFRPKDIDVLWPVLGAATKEKIKDAARRWSAAGRYFGNTKNLPTSNLPKE